MKQVTSAILLLVASTLAAAVEPVSGTNQSLVVAYNDSQASNNVAATEALASKQETKRVLEKTLDVVSAQLSVEIETPFDKQFIARN